MIVHCTLACLCTKCVCSGRQQAGHHIQRCIRMFVATPQPLLWADRLPSWIYPFNQRNWCQAWYMVLCVCIREGALCIFVSGAVYKSGLCGAVYVFAWGKAMLLFLWLSTVSLIWLFSEGSVGCQAIWEAVLALFQLWWHIYALIQVISEIKDWCNCLFIYPLSASYLWGACQVVDHMDM